MSCCLSFKPQSRLTLSLAFCELIVCLVLIKTHKLTADFAAGELLMFLNYLPLLMKPCLGIVVCELLLQSLVWFQGYLLKLLSLRMWVIAVLTTVCVCLISLHQRVSDRLFQDYQSSLSLSLQMVSGCYYWYLFKLTKFISKFAGGELLCLGKSSNLLTLLSFTLLAPTTCESLFSLILLYVLQTKTTLDFCRMYVTAIYNINLSLLISFLL